MAREARDDIVYFYLVKYIWTPSSYPPVHQPSGYLHLLPMIYDCSPRGIHSATTDSEEWKISHFREKYFQRVDKEKLFQAWPIWYTKSYFYMMSDRVWWGLLSGCLSPSNTQFCHHKSFSMFFLWQFSLGKKKITKKLKWKRTREIFKVFNVLFNGREIEYEKNINIINNRN